MFRANAMLRNSGTARSIKAKLCKGLLLGERVVVIRSQSQQISVDLIYLQTK